MLVVKSTQKMLTYTTKQQYLKKHLKKITSNPDAGGARLAW